MEAVSPEKLASFEAEYKTIDDANKLRANEIRIGSNGEWIISTESIGAYQVSQFI
jgi:hypothetical protein